MGTGPCSITRRAPADWRCDAKDCPDAGGECRRALVCVFDTIIPSCRICDTGRKEASVCEFCAEHGEGKKWYLEMKNYSDRGHGKGYRHGGLDHEAALRLPVPHDREG